jgi:aryl-alcohol dehydrogenase-like predicted oxidoreductase
VSSVIVGAKTPEQLADNLGATRLDLTTEDLQSLEEVSKLQPEYPGWMIERQGQYRTQPPARP